MSVFSAFDICATGMTAQRTRLDIISQNIANVNTTRDGDGNPYMRKSVIFEEKSYVSFDDAGWRILRGAMRALTRRWPGFTGPMT